MDFDESRKIKQKKGAHVCRSISLADRSGFKACYKILFCVFSLTYRSDRKEYVCVAIIYRHIKKYRNKREKKREEIGTNINIGDINYDESQNKI